MRTIHTMTAWSTGQHETVRARIAAHRAADEIIQGIGWNGKRGCAIGCSLDVYDHEEFATVVIGNNARNDGIKIARLVDRLHELLPLDLALDWPGRVANALTPGADTTHVLARWFVWFLRVELHERDITTYGEQIAVLDERRIAGDEPDANEWTDAADAAYDAVSAIYDAAVAATSNATGYGAYSDYPVRVNATYGSATRMADALIEIMAATTPWASRKPIATAMKGG